MPRQIKPLVSRVLIVIAFLTVFYRAAEVPAAQAATQIVSDCSAPSGAAGRLVDVITAASAGDTITFSCSGTITLSATITLDKNLIIDGSGQAVTISGGDAVGVFVVNSGVYVTLSHLTITHGYTWRGGGIGNWGILTVTDSTLSANRAQNPGGVGYYGGGIYNGGTLTVTNSTLTGNVANYVSGATGGGGGGIYNVATLVVVNSTLTGNSTVGNSWSDVGAGISQYGGSLTMRNSTLYGNNSRSAFGSGLFNQGGTLNYANSILYSTTGSGADCYSNAAPATNTNNLVKTSSGCGTPALTSDPLLNALANNGGSTWTMAPSLSPRSPVINAGSDAVCAASPVNGLDQRGITRPNGAHCDIGAVELVLPSTKDITDFRFNSLGAVGTINGTNITVLVPLGTNVTALVPTIAHTGVSISPSSGVAQNFTNPIVYTVTADDASTKAYTVTVILCNSTITVANANDIGAGSIRQAIADVCPGGAINFDASLAGINIGLNSQLVIAKAVTIDASALSSRVGLFGNNAHRVLYTNGTNVTLNNLMIYFGRTVTPDVDGGGIFNQGHLTILNGYIWGNIATNYGGGIFNAGTLTVTNSTLQGNSAAYGGGLTNSGTATVVNSTIRNSDASSDGGAIYNNTGNILTLSNTTVYFNRALGGGGGAINYGVLNVSNSTFSDNGATLYASDIFNLSTLNLANTILANSNGGSNCYSFGAVIPAGTNLIESNVNCGAALTADPALGGLGSNGGSTDTMVPGTGSPAIDTGSDAVCAASPVNGRDQRGMPRPQGLHCDLGAVEVGDITQKDITSFTFTSPAATGVIGTNTIAVTVPYGTNVTALISTITHTGAAMTPASGVAQDYTNPIIYTVTAVDGSTKAYTVNVTVALNPAKSITAFTIPGQIGGTTIDEGAGTIALTVPYGSLTALVPTIVHTGASVNPASGAAQDFTNPVIYTVTAADSSTKAYTVTVTMQCSSAITVANANNSGVGSLRQAITDLCAGGTITFGGDYSIPLDSTLTLNKNLTIDAAGRTVTVNGQNSVRVFSVNAGVTAVLNNLAIANGNTGGSGAGGGINNHGTLTVRNSTFASNSGSAGGGIYNNANLTIANSTFSANYAGWGQNGGGIYNDGTVTLLNSTFSGNRADWGGGSIFNVGSLNYANTIFANSTVGGGGLECFNFGGAIGTNTNNLVGDGTCSAAISGSPNLGPLASNGGRTQTFALLPGSPAIDAGHDATCAAAPISGLDQRGQTRSRGTHCDIGAYEYALKEITAFNFASPATTGVIVGSNITLTVPYGTNVTALVPTITHTGSSVSPASGVAQNYTNPIGYTVTAADGSTHAYVVTVIVALNPAKAITAFTIPDQVGGSIINEGAGTIAVTVLYGTDVTALIPTITHTGASVSPNSGVAQNFTNPVIYTVTAEDGTTKAYAVTVTMQACLAGVSVANANDTGAGSLRRAIMEACPGSTITFGGDYNILLGSTLTLGKHLAIDAAGRTVTVNGQNAVRVFTVNGSVTAVLNNLTIANGNTGGSGAGGGIDNHGTLTVKNSTLASNTANAGGGIYNAGSLTVANSTFSANYAAWGQNGGGIYNDGTVTLLNTTFSGNRADWGGGSIFNVGTLHYANTIMANSTVGGGGLECFNYGGAIGTNLNNLVEGGTCFAALSGDPQLGPLVSNGGRTQSFALLPGSPAFDAGDDATCAAAPVSGLDQRGLARPQGAHCDIGVFEVATKDITAFNFASPAATGIIVGTNIAVTVPYGTNVTALIPTITHTGSSINPASGVPQNFTNPIGYTVTAADGTTQAYLVTVTVALNSAKSITAFTIPGQVGGTSINEGAGTIALTMPYGTAVTALVPTITHTGASINPASGAARDFTNPIGYTVTADDGSTKVYTVTVTVALNPAKAITAFTIPGQVGDSTINEGAGTIAVVVPYGTNVAALVPTITHTGASANPASGAAQNFTTPVVYTVTAADGSTKTYTVSVTMVCGLNTIVANTGDSGAGSLRQTMADTCADGTITFDAGLSGGTIALASQLNLNRNVTIDGSALTMAVTLDGQNATRVVNVTSGVVATLRALTIVNGNSAVAGGGIYNYYGTLTVTNSTLAGNFGAQGGGIFNDYGTLTVANSTLSGNIAEWSGGGIYNYNGTLRLLNSTLSGNRTNQTYGYGGGLYNYGTLQYANTIMANSPHGADCVIDGGSIVTNLNNLVEDGGCSAGGVNFKTGDPRLGALQNNGGSTPTFVLQLDSPAIDAGDAATCAGASIGGLDQRGQTRDDLRCDIGAFELKYADSPTVTKAVSGAGTYTFGPTMIKIVVNNTGAGACLTGVTIQRYNVNHPNATTAIQTGHWWDITPIGCTSGFNVDLTLPTDFTPDANSKVCRWNPGGPGYQWDCAVNSSTSSSITRNGVTGFSQWAVGNNAGPTAVTLNSLTARGESNSAGGLALGGLLVLVSMGTLSWRKRRVR